MVRSPANPLRAVFDERAIRRLCRSGAPSPELLRRLAVLGACGPRPSDPAASTKVRRWRARKAAWEVYFEAAFCCGLFEGEHGRELSARLTSPEAKNFRSALAECLACWFLAGRLKWQIEPRPEGRPGKTLELRTTPPGSQPLNVEVKAPYVETPVNGWSGDDADVLAKCLVEANRQFERGRPNLLLIVPKLRLSVVEYRYQLLRALIAEEKIVVTFDHAGRPAATRTAFFPEGMFLRDWSGQRRYTRISAAACIEEHLVERSEGAWIDHRCIVVHNPSALVKIPAEIWRPWPQFIEAEDGWKWSDGRSLHP